MKISYNWLKWYVDPLPNADELAEKIIFGAFEVESFDMLTTGNDWIFDIKVLPDRAHDCLSHQGMAREIAGLLGSQFIDPTNNYIIPESQSTNLQIDIQTDLCRRYAARIIRNVKIGPSPDWIVKHLESIGQKSINNIVDATNLVMFDCGQPTHAFDIKKLESEKIIIQTVDTETVITTLSGEEKILQSGEMVIADEKNILAIAGVKGGNHAEVDQNTTDILIEVANFDPTTVRKTARRLNILTDSAKRFENELTPELVSYAMHELSATILEMCPDAIFEDVVDVYPNPTKQQHVQFSTSYIAQKLGTDISSENIATILTQYHYEFAQENDTFTVAIPFARIDITGPHDMVEEIGRVYGYNNISPKLPELSQKPSMHTEYAKILAVKNDLIQKGYHEVMTYSFRKKGDYEVARGPVGKSALRKNLIDGLTESFEMNRLNKDFLEIDDMKVFEIGTVFEKTGEVFHIAYIDKKQSKEMALDVYIQENNITIPDAYVLPEIQIEKEFIPWLDYPCISRDIAVWVPEGTAYETIQEIVTKNAGEFLIKGPRLFDTFSKDGKTSYAFRMVFQAKDRTLTEEEVSSPMQKITEKLTEQDWEVR
jgi:phenylalanyl-tRNA synthetase beta chain